MGEETEDGPSSLEWGHKKEQNLLCWFNEILIVHQTDGIEVNPLGLARTNHCAHVRKRRGVCNGECEVDKIS